jgi:hypothetical protein
VETLSWSFGVLYAAQALFARLGVFPAPFTVSAVEDSRSRPSVLLTEQQQVCSNSICARAGSAAALVW